MTLSSDAANLLTLARIIESDPDGPAPKRGAVENNSGLHLDAVAALSAQLRTIHERAAALQGDVDTARETANALAKAIGATAALSGETSDELSAASTRARELNGKHNVALERASVALYAGSEKMETTKDDFGGLQADVLRAATQLGAINPSVRNVVTGTAEALRSVGPPQISNISDGVIPDAVATGGLMESAVRNIRLGVQQMAGGDSA